MRTLTGWDAGRFTGDKAASRRGSIAALYRPFRRRRRHRSFRTSPRKTQAPTPLSSTVIPSDLDTQACDRSGGSECTDSMTFVNNHAKVSADRTDPRHEDGSEEEKQHHA